MVARLVFLSSLCLCFGLVSGGCPGPVSNEITVRVVNDTDFDVDPAVEFGRSPFSLENLDIGILAPGDVVEADFNCADARALTTTNSTQFGLLSDFVLDPLPIFELDADYFCGELIEIDFVGNGQDFDVFVDAGGENIF